MSVSVNDNPEHLHAAGLPLSVESPAASENPVAAGGSLIINADDWGRDAVTTDHTLELILAGRVSSGSAMLFMQDSERAAGLAREHAVDTGLHLNFTLPFTGPGCSANMKDRQNRIARFLLSHRLAPIVYRPDLASSFEYIVRTQLEEYERLYGVQPQRIDGHHHMHLCANVTLQRLLPANTIIRRNFTFIDERKGLLNRLYRGWQDRQLARRHRMADYFFDLIPMTPERLSMFFALATEANVEIETHLYRDEEYEFLAGPTFLELLGGVKVSPRYGLCFPPQCKLQVPQDAPKRTMEQFAAVDKIQPVADLAQLTASKTIPHISVCVCTYKRPAPLLRLLEELSRQETQGMFTYSVSIVDNDRAGSAASIVAEYAATSKMQILYIQEPARGIARARNKVVTQSVGDYLAFIDDDEFPAHDWLLNALLDCRRFNADGVLGPVRCVFEGKPPAWLEKSQLLQRKIHPGGQLVEWRGSRTSNVLIKHSVVLGDVAPFRIDIRAGEDQEFFYRKTNEGHRFVWSDRAIVSEVIPPARCRRRYIVRRALLQGACESSLPAFTLRRIVKSIIAVPVYAVALPFSLLMGGHRFAAILEKFSYHLGKLLMAVGINPIHEEYVSD
jgi:hypothetical protein